MRKQIRWICLGLCFLITGQAVFCEEKGTPLGFRYALIRQDSETQHKKPLLAEGKIFVPREKLVKFYFYPRTQAYIYLFHVDSNGQFSVLFLPLEHFLKREYTGETTYLVPSGETDWFQFSADTQYDRFYLFASSTPLGPLSNLSAAYLKLLDSPENEPGKAELLITVRQQLQEEIKKLQKKYLSTLQAEIPDPVRGAGTIKGFVTEWDIYATSVEGHDFYAKTFWLEH